MGEKAHLLDDDVADFGSDRNPFSENAEEVAFFPGGHRRQYLESLLHLTRFGRPVMVVSGQEGIGKTLLKEQFLAFVDENAFTAVELEPSLESEVEFYTELCHQLGIRTAGMAREELSNVILQFAEDLGLQAKTLVIVIDDAHALSDDALSAIFRLCQASESRSCQLHFLLFGAQSLLEVFEQDEYVGEFSAFGQSLLMDPLSEEETREYIHYRLESVGIPSVEFTRNQMQTIYLNSGGVPAEINRYAYALMAQPKIVKSRGISPRFQWIAGGAVAAMFAVGLFIARESSVTDTGSNAPLADANNGAVLNGAGDGRSVALPP
ncbi:MAG TPA: AAA family ATPase, partial [Pseudomonadales bacterium]|nr:AAA family ATPase [Pseudomonadales bacterium]